MRKIFGFVVMLIGGLLLLFGGGCLMVFAPQLMREKNWNKSCSLA